MIRDYIKRIEKIPIFLGGRLGHIAIRVCAIILVIAWGTFLIGGKHSNKKLDGETHSIYAENTGYSAHNLIDDNQTADDSIATNQAADNSLVKDRITGYPTIKAPIGNAPVVGEPIDDSTANQIIDDEATEGSIAEDLTTRDSIDEESPEKNINDALYRNDGHDEKNKNEEEYKEHENNKTGVKGMAHSIINDWRILLVNADNPVPKGYLPKLSRINSDVKFDERAADDFKSLIKACRNETGFSLQPRTAYRDRKTQEMIFKDKVRQHMNRGKSKEEAQKLANNYIAVPGTSEHEIGLAVDFNILKVKFEDSRVFKWLDENAYKYGFILRYPKDKQSITKIKYEPWHFRYVGKGHAKRMKSNNLCLEEYTEYLRDQFTNKAELGENSETTKMDIS